MFLIRWALNLLRLVAETLLALTLLMLILLWGLNWIPFMPVPVIQKHFSERVPQWGWAGSDEIPQRLLHALQEVEKLPTFHKPTAIPAKVAVQMFYPERSRGTGSFFLGEILALLWSERRLWIFHANSVCFGEDIYGVKAAAARLWHKKLSELTPEEIAELAVRTHWPHPHSTLPATLQREKRLLLRKVLS
ncbi:MAG: transglycosylase domain-containing protein [Bacteroidia bacterium]|nr:transglycosylase domain-containing protein [Bacteroidia bacterium]MDW8236099.1 transglycosylase domain-containing protein [Bacteroidia bacterium]